MNKEIEYVEELFDELTELARWDGCETGDLCHALMDLKEGSSSYASETFQKCLDQEIRDLYNILKEQKMEEDMDAIQNIVPMSTDEMKELVLAKLTDEEKKILGL